VQLRLAGRLPHSGRAFASPFVGFLIVASLTILLEKLHANLHNELLLKYDSQNVRNGGLNFQGIIRLNREN